MSNCDFGKSPVCSVVYEIFFVQNIGAAVFYPAYNFEICTPGLSQGRLVVVLKF